MQIGIGEWKMRNGKMATIVGKRIDQGCLFPWIGWHADCYSICWSDTGDSITHRLIGDKDTSIISPWTSPIAKGHNPDKLTEEQVGNGFRVPDWNEIENLSGEKKQKALEYWQASLKAWIQPDSCGCCMTGTYRTRLSRSELAALDKPKKRLIRVDELPAMCWCRRSVGNAHLVTSRNEKDGIVFANDKWPIEGLKFHGYQWSSDLKTWNPFEVEEK